MSCSRRTPRCRRAPTAGLRKRGLSSGRRQKQPDRVDGDRFVADLLGLIAPADPSERHPRDGPEDRESDRDQWPRAPRGCPGPPSARRRRSRGDSCPGFRRRSRRHRCQRAPGTRTPESAGPPPEPCARDTSGAGSLAEGRTTPTAEAPVPTSRQGSYASRRRRLSPVR